MSKAIDDASSGAGAGAGAGADGSEGTASEIPSFESPGSESIGAGGSEGVTGAGRGAGASA